ncbi:helix-turn-helix transcriptional regulator [Streptomyces zagrosensis]|uniref:Sugar-specific transcriptional regulator TrmB/DNA-binding CsgD family transcriptional regulator n=1 Tax=Streptomyces zagrosensis TaxID=1042984 RepID=A0A7W9Q469_9ACTN|nr:LuxR family transcriptional regulator [Streptomyces zagrosensis]MBB5933096.1 sugar-specific transcriptional regulator TrmB/DNA-binding CsgD family transcriptional regulator [Streptomyces zagrosensis]
MPDALLEPVGLGATESALYLHVLSTPRCTTAQLAEAVGATPAQVRPCLRRLEDAGLISRLAGKPARYAAAPPSVAFDALAERRHQELEELREHIRELSVRFQGATANSPGDLIELVEGPHAVRDRVEQLQLGAQREMLVVDCPPYFSSSSTENPIEDQLLRRGVDCRVIYDASDLELPGRMGFVLDCIAKGEDARSLPSARLKMLIADRSNAMIPLVLEASESSAAILVRPSPLLTAIVTCFDLMWERASPIAVSAPPDGPLDERDRELLSMLAGGMKDASIIRALGITQRTMTRRVAQLMTLMDAQTRFQAGLQAARRGWL